MNTVTVSSPGEINYGAVLQAYALQQQLFKLNVDDRLVDLKNSSPVYFIPWNSNLPFVSKVYNNLINFLYIVPARMRVQKFKKFVKDNIKLTKFYNTIDEIKNDPPEADVYITGSDQMFNCYSGVNDFNFLRFGSENVKRISYSTSIGQMKINEAYINEFVDAIKKYESISVREASLKDYISEICGRDCEVNIDPTFLLDKEEWDKFTGNRLIKEKYILCYALLNNPLINQSIEQLKLATGLKVVVLNAQARNYINGDVIIRSAGLEEFLNLVKNAEYVLTTSFHGTCFSIIFEKKFFAFIRKGVETRITNIVEKFHLENRIVSDVSTIHCDDINYEEVGKVILLEKQRSIEYLSRVLGIV